MPGGPMGMPGTARPTAPGRGLSRRLTPTGGPWGARAPPPPRGGGGAEGAARHGQAHCPRARLEQALDLVGRHMAFQGVAAHGGRVAAAEALRHAELLAHRSRVRNFDDFDREAGGDRKSTRLNSSHSQISYALFFF